MQDQEFIKYTNDQIVALKKTTEELKQVTGQNIDTVNSSQASILVEIEALKKEIRELSGRVEDNEHLIKYNLEKELGEEGNAKAEISKFSERIDHLERMVNHHHLYLNLEPFEYIDTRDGSSSPVSDSSKTLLNTINGVEKPKDLLLYEAGRDLFENGSFEKALSSFNSFLETYPKSDLADNAQFWIGECYMSLKQYDHAIHAFENVKKNYPDQNKVPNAMLRQAIAMQEIGDETSTKILLKQLIKTYPKSPEAKIAEKELAALK